MKLNLGALISLRSEYRVLALMLALLHFSLSEGVSSPLAQPLMLTHLGLFLIWQPLWSRASELKWSSGLVFLLAAIGFVLWLNWWLMAFWLLLLIGIVGGRVTISRADRLAYLAALLFLFAELLITCVPVMFDVEITNEETARVLSHGLLVLPVMVYLVPAQPTVPTHSRVDFLYGLLISMLASILALGGLFRTFQAGTPYIEALLQTVVAITLFLLAIGWLWSPLAGFSGLGQLWERYLLNIGTPFEQWLGRLAESADSQATPHEFLLSAMGQLTALPWVAGARWEVPGDKRLLGAETAHSFRIGIGELQCMIFARREVGTALLMHGKLLVQLVGHFYSAKQREAELAKSAHMQAIYETGARVTHDIKNLLQSLHTMTAAMERRGDDPRVRALLERQLPHLSQRLKLALDKLQAPGQATLSECNARDWWSATQRQNAAGAVSFDARIESDPLIPHDLFDSVLENLLENARRKRQTEPAIRIEVRLMATDEALRLSVCDDGDAVDESVASMLFKGPVKSRNGLGIGLYQASRQAEALGYSLELSHSERGHVCFALTRRDGLKPPPHPLRRHTDRAGTYASIGEKGTG